MISRRFVQFGGAVGIAAVVVLLGAVFAASDTLSSSSSVAHISGYLTSHRSGVLTQTALTVLGSALMLCFAATLGRLLHARDQHSPLGMIVLAAGAGMAAIASLDGITLSALVFASKQGGLTAPALTRTFFDLQNGLIMPGAFGCMAAVLLAAIGTAAVRRVFAASWLGWLSFVLAGLALAGSMIGLTSAGGGTAALGYSPALGASIVMLISSVFMLRDSAGATEPAPARMTVPAAS